MTPPPLRYFSDNARHLVCYPYSLKNLIRMAEDLGIGRHWFHLSFGGKGHYDIPKFRIEEMRYRTEVVDTRTIVRITRGEDPGPPRPPPGPDMSKVGSYQKPKKLYEGKIPFAKDAAPHGPPFASVPRFTDTTKEGSLRHYAEPDDWLSKDGLTEWRDNAVIQTMMKFDHFSRGMSSVLAVMTDPNGATFPMSLNDFETIMQAHRLRQDGTVEGITEWAVKKQGRNFLLIPFQDFEPRG